MAFVELKPGRFSAGEACPQVKIGRRKSGRINVSFNAAAAAKWGLVKGAKLTALADLASTPRILRIVVGTGPFLAGCLRKGGAMIVLDLPELEHVEFEGGVCIHEEDEDGKGRRMIDVTLPAALQTAVIPGQARPPAAAPKPAAAPARVAPERPPGGTALEREIASTAAFSHHRNRNGSAARG